MLTPLFDVEPQGGRWSQKLGHYRNWTYVIFQMIGPATAFLAHSRQDLMTDTQAGRQGLQITQAAGIVRLWWKGDLWASASAPTQIEFIPIETGQDDRGLLQMA